MRWGVQQKCLLLSQPFLRKGSKNLAIFLHQCSGQQGPSFKDNGFSEKSLNPGLQGIQCCVKNVFFGFFRPFLNKVSKDLAIFLYECRGQQGPSLKRDGFSEKSLKDNRAHCWSQMLFAKIFLIPVYWGLSVKKGVFDFFYPFLQNGLRDPPNFFA